MDDTITLRADLANVVEVEAWLTERGFHHARASLRDANRGMSWDKSTGPGIPVICVFNTSVRLEPGQTLALLPKRKPRWWRGPELVEDRLIAVDGGTE